MRPTGLYSFTAGSISVEVVDSLRPKAATKIALSEILAARIRQHCRAELRMKRLAVRNYERFVEEVK